MFFVIMITIAVWFIPNIPIAIPILTTIACSLHCLAVIIKACVKAYKKQNEPKKTGIPQLDRFL